MTLSLTYHTEDRAWSCLLLPYLLNARLPYLSALIILYLVSPDAFTVCFLRYSVASVLVLTLLYESV